MPLAEELINSAGPLPTSRERLDPLQASTSQGQKVHDCMAARATNSLHRLAEGGGAALKRERDKGGGGGDMGGPTRRVHGGRWGAAATCSAYVLCCGRLRWHRSGSERLDGGLVTRSPGIRLHQRVVRRGVHSVAIGLPFLVFLLLEGPVGLARPIQLGAVSYPALDAVHVKAGLREEILAHGTVFAALNAHLPVDTTVLARGHRPQKRLERSLREDLQAAEPPILHVLAVLEVHAFGRDVLV